MRYNLTILLFLFSFFLSLSLSLFWFAFIDCCHYSFALFALRSLILKYFVCYMVKVILSVVLFSFCFLSLLYFRGKWHGNYVLASSGTIKNWIVATWDILNESWLTTNNRNKRNKTRWIFGRWVLGGKMKTINSILIRCTHRDNGFWLACLKEYILIQKYPTKTH